MSNPTFSMTDLENLKRAFASGVLRVKLQDRETEYRSIAELTKAIETVEKELSIRQKGPFFIQLGKARGAK